MESDGKMKKEKYILLNVGDKIKNGDEYFEFSEKSRKYGTWVGVEESESRGRMIGMILPDCYGPFRRMVKLGEK